MRYKVKVLTEPVVHREELLLVPDQDVCAPPENEIINVFASHCPFKMIFQGTSSLKEYLKKIFFFFSFLLFYINLFLRIWQTRHLGCGLDRV